MKKNDIMRSCISSLDNWELDNTYLTTEIQLPQGFGA